MSVNTTLSGRIDRAFGRLEVVESANIDKIPVLTSTAGLRLRQQRQDDLALHGKLLLASWKLDKRPITGQSQRVLGFVV